MAKPIEITLYNPETNEVVKTFTRSFVPWAILKKALRLQKTIDSEAMTEDDVDELAGLVVAVFGDQFTLDQVNTGMDVGEMVTVLNAVIARATQFTPPTNPTTAAG